MFNQMNIIVRTSLPWLLFTILFSIHGVAAAEKKQAPNEIAGTIKVSAEEFLDILNEFPELSIIDSRVSMDRKQGYIEGSINLPDEETDCERLAAIIPDQYAPALFYCNGPKCGRSVNAIEVALDCGYQQLYWLRGGYEEWLEKDYPVMKP